MSKVVKLGDVCKLEYGKALEKACRLEKGKIPAYGANGVKTFSTKALYSKPSIIIGRKGSAGELNKVSKPFWALDVAYYVKYDDKKIKLDFLFYTLSFLNLPSMAKGVKPGINRNEVYEKEIKLPTLSEQNYIVDKLDNAFSAINELIVSIELRNEKIEQLKSALLFSSFNIEISKSELCNKVKLKEVCLLRRGSTITKKQTVDGEVPVIGGGTKPTYFHNKSNRDVNCITISSSGASAGYVNKWDVPIFASDCSTVEAKDETQLQNFIYYFLLSKQKFIYKNFRSGAAQPHVYAKDVETIDYPIVPLSKQIQIVAKLDHAFVQIDKFTLCTKLINKKIEKLKSALLCSYINN